MRLELQLGIFQISLELATFGCNSPNQPTRITHILLFKSACECDESYEKSPPANFSFGFATKSLLYETIVNFNLFYYQVCATAIGLRSLFFILSPIITARAFCAALQTYTNFHEFNSIRKGWPHLPY